jgi:hypothetical protein
VGVSGSPLGAEFLGGKQQQVAALQQRVGELERQMAALQQRLAVSVVLDEEKQAEVAAVARANGTRAC